MTSEGTAAARTLTAAERASGIELIERAYLEDLGPAGIDLTAAATEGTSLRARLVAREEGVVCGLELAMAAFAARGVDHARQLVRDGSRVSAGGVLVELAGAAPAILAAERTALNLVQRLSGTATLTAAFVRAAGRPVIHDTRKTMPGMRALQRWAVRCGGGRNHRFGLYDEAMLKDNHIAACGGIAPAVAAVRAAHPQVRIHVEADTLEQAEVAVAAGADVVLFDNMSLDELRDGVEFAAGRCLTEASGGVTLDTVGAIAATGVDRISVGALTHSAPAFDVALDA